MVLRALLVVAAALVAVPGGAPARDDLGPTPPSTQLRIALSLKLDQQLLARDLARGARPLPSAKALGARYGLPLADIGRAVRILRAGGIAVTEVVPQRTEIVGRARVGVLSRFFGVRFRDYVDPAGRPFHAPTGRPTIPRSLRPYVSAVVGLSTRSVALPADLPHGTLRPDDALAAYDLAPLRQKVDGSGTTIAILSLERFPPSEDKTRDDVKTFRGTFNARGPDPQDVKVDGGGTSSDLSEDNLDLDVVSAIAPGAQIINYEAPSTAAGELDLFTRLVADGKAGIASFSWGICDRGLPSQFRAAVVQALQLAVRRGITVFVASGDSGSYDCQRADFSDHSLTVDFPADLPQVVGVGGTLLSVSADGTYFGEAGWEDTLSNAGGGGGVNPHDAAPSWQATAGAGAGGHRGVPDVAATASPSSGWLVRDSGGWSNVGGTSAASPFWAASMLLAEQYARSQGVTKRCFLAPILYKLASTQQPYPPFHDVVLGGNRYYDAKKGWDYATGLGSPDVWNLTRDLTAYLRTHPCGPGA